MTSGTTRSGRAEAPGRLAIEGAAAADLHRDYVSYMPRLAESRDKAGILDAQIRVWLLGKMLSRLYLMWRVDGRFKEGDEEQMVDVPPTRGSTA